MNSNKPEPNTSTSDKGRVPLSFSNPLQQMTQQQRHLETVFAAETVTYSTPSSTNHSRGGGGIPIEPRITHEVYELDSKSSLDSSLSTTPPSSSSNKSSIEDEIDVEVTQGLENGYFSLSKPSNASSSNVMTSSLKRGSNDDLITGEAVSTTAVSSAHLKTGLRQVKPNETPRKKNLSQKGSELGSLKADSPNSKAAMSTSNKAAASTADEVTQDKFVGVHLSQFEESAVLELNELAEFEESMMQLKNCTSPKAVVAGGSQKLEDGFVTAAAVPIVKSRVVVQTSNAARVKTSKRLMADQKNSANAAAASRNHHTPMARRAINQRNRPSLPEAASAIHKSSHLTSTNLPPSSPEDIYFPEARTAQWILNSIPSTGKDSTPDSETPPPVLTPKDYEDRIVLLEKEVERLTALINANVHSQRSAETAQRSAERRESQLQDKIRSLERRDVRSSEKLHAAEEMLKKHREESDRKIRDLSQKLEQLDATSRKERAKLRLTIEEKDTQLADKDKTISRLERANRKLQRTVNHSHHLKSYHPSSQSPVDNTTSSLSQPSSRHTSTSSEITYIDDNNDSAAASCSGHNSASM